MDKIKLEVVRDLSKLRAVNPTQFSMVLALMIIDDYAAYNIIMTHLSDYDLSSGSAKLVEGNKLILEEISLDLRSAIIDYVYASGSNGEL